MFRVGDRVQRKRGVLYPDSVYPSYQGQPFVVEGLSNGRVRMSEGSETIYHAFKNLELASIATETTRRKKGKQQ